MREELINALSSVQGLRGVARTSAFRYKGKTEDIRRIGSDPDVEYIFEGSITLRASNILQKSTLRHNARRQPNLARAPEVQT
jgi:TolB-like protein